MATMGMWSLRASLMALRSFRGSTTKRAPGSFFISVTPPRYFSSLAISPMCLMTSFLGSMSKVPSSCIFFS